MKKPKSSIRFNSEAETGRWPSSFSATLSNDPRTPLARCAQYESAEIRSRRASRMWMSPSEVFSSIKKGSAPGAGRTHNHQIRSLFNHQIRSLLLYPLSYGGGQKLCEIRPNRSKKGHFLMFPCPFSPLFPTIPVRKQ